MIRAAVPLLVALAACSQRALPERSAAGQPMHAAYQNELKSRLVTDQAIRDTFVAEIKSTGSPSIATIRRMNHIDSANTNWLEPKIRAGEVDGQDLALLTDRVAKARGRPQPYGVQTTLRDGKLASIRSRTPRTSMRVARFRHRIHQHPALQIERHRRTSREIVRRPIDGAGRKEGARAAPLAYRVEGS